MNRLFVFGDSWANNYLANKQPHSAIPNIRFLNNSNIKQYAAGVNYWGHWVDHFNSFFETTTFGIGNASFEQIIYQLGNLPDYREGDRCVVIFSVPTRFTWYSNNYPVDIALGNYLYLENVKDVGVKNLLDNQFLQRDWAWKNIKNMNEKKFLHKLKWFLKEYDPIFLTWSEDTYRIMKDFHYINYREAGSLYTTIEKESNRKCRDGHLGVKGNYHLFKFIASLLGINTSNYEPDLPSYKLNLL